MKAIILSAGQGRRLLPFTADLPKCLLPVDAGRTVLEFQLRTLAQCGIDRVTIMVGFGTDKVEQFLLTNPVPGVKVHTRYNPFFATSNNLITCWLASAEMSEDFILLNGDSLFEAEALRRVLAAPSAPVTLTINRKSEYDDDDMKVSLNGGRRLKAVGKTLPRATVHGESIGLIRFCGEGMNTFRVALEEAVRGPEALQRWYLSVLNTMCLSSVVETVSIEGLWWGEIDTPEDLAKVRSHFLSRTIIRPRVVQRSL